MSRGSWPARCRPQPTATSGTMCVYIAGGTTNAGTTTFLFPGSQDEEDGADNTGFYLGVNAPAPGEVLVRFVWVYKAP